MYAFGFYFFELFAKLTHAIIYIYIRKEKNSIYFTQNHKKSMRFKITLLVLTQWAKSPKKQSEGGRFY